MATLASCYNPRRLSTGEVPGDAVVQASKGQESEQGRARRFRLSSLQIRPLLYQSLNFIHHTLDWSLAATSCFFLILFALNFPHPAKWDGLWLVVRCHRLGDPMIAQVVIGVRDLWPSFSYAGYLPLGFALASWLTKKRAAASLVTVLGLLRKPRTSEEKVVPTVLFREEEEETGVVDSEQARETLLKRYREIEGALKTAKRKRCAFLAIDIAGSTQMKDGERELPITITFQAYMDMLEEIFSQHSAWKLAWTPDGVMVCFLDLDSAVAAGQTVLRRLRAFNRTENLLRTRISVRCGLNAGEIPIYEDSKLEKIAHEVIDVTGHMQKRANPGTLWLSAEVYSWLHDKSGFNSTGKEVDGYKVFEWMPNFALPERRPPTAVPPPKLGDNDPTWA